MPCALLAIPWMFRTEHRPRGPFSGRPPVGGNPQSIREPNPGSIRKPKKRRCAIGPYPLPHASCRKKGLYPKTSQRRRLGHTGAVRIQQDHLRWGFDPAGRTRPSQGPRGWVVAAQKRAPIPGAGPCGPWPCTGIPGWAVRPGAPPRNARMGRAAQVTTTEYRDGP